MDTTDRRILRVLQQDARITMTALAEYICADRSAMMREVKKMTEDGLIQISRRHVRLLQCADELLEDGPAQ